MKRILLFLLSAAAYACTQAPAASDYAIVAGPGIADDPQWSAVVEALRESHPGARVIRYRDSVREALPALRGAAPRYVAFVDRPERIGRDYIIELNRMSREADRDIYADYLWGVITGYDAEAALRMVRNAREPLVIRSAVSTLREVGETRLPMLASVAAILVNLVFNYFLIFGKCGFPEMGVTGAAIATVLSRYIETAIIVVYTHTRKEYFPFIHGAYRSLRVPSPLMSGILRRGTPLLVNEFLWSSGMAVLLQCYSVRGLDVVAACNIATTVSNLFKVVFLSMGNAVAIMVGQALGANDIERAKNCTWRLMTAAVGSNLFMSILLILFAPSIPHIYNTEPHVRQIATQLLYVIAMMMPAYSFSHCCYFTLRSGGKTIITFLFDSVFTWCVNVPTAWLLAYRTGMGIVPLYFCVQALELIKVVIGFALVKKGVWIHNIVAPVAEKEAAEK